MQVLLNATYKNGTLILDKRLGIEKEGRNLKLYYLNRNRAKSKRKGFLNL